MGYISFLNPPKVLCKIIYSTYTYMFIADLRDILRHPLHYLDPRSEVQYMMAHASLIGTILVVLRDGDIGTAIQIVRHNI